MPDDYDPEWVELEKVMGKPHLPDDVHELRVFFNTALIGAAQHLPATDTGIQTQDEQIFSAVKVRVYTPPGGSMSLPLIVFCHGGGWQAGNLDTEDHLCRTVCAGVGCIVVSVEYRTWPFMVYQTMVDDCYIAYEWAYEHADVLGANVERYSIWGGSAGASLAVGVAGKLVASGQGSKIYGLVCMAATIIQPDVVPAGYKHLHTSFIDNAGNVPIVTGEEMIGAWGRIVGDPAYRDKSLFPLVGAPEALRGFPRTYVIDTDKDACRDDGTVLEAALKDAGISVKRDTLPGLPHYFWCFAVEKAGRKFRETLVDGIKWMISAEP